MDLDKVASRVARTAILLGGPSEEEEEGPYESFPGTSHSVKLDPNSWYDTPTYIFKGKFKDHDGSVKDVEIVIVYQREAAHGIKSVNGIDPNRVNLPPTDPDALGASHPVWHELNEIILDSDAYADMDEVYNGPTPAQKQMMDVWEQRTPGQPGVSHPTVGDVLPGTKP